MTDAQALAHASKLAMAGDNRWARKMAEMAHPPFSKELELSKKGQFGKQFPPEIPNDQLYWRELAAKRGDAQSQIGYWTTVDAIPRYADTQSLPANALEELQVNARRYMQSAMDAGVADAYSYGSAAYRDGKLGVPKDPIKAHACLVALVNVYAKPETLQLLEASASRLRTGEVSQAQALAADPANCRIQ
jgi:hypothetical protein